MPRSPADSGHRRLSRPPPCTTPVALATVHLLPFIDSPADSSSPATVICSAPVVSPRHGHFGFIKLPVSIYHPSHIAELTKILSMICFSCLQFKNCKKQKSEGKESNFTSCSYCQVV